MPIARPWLMWATNYKLHLQRLYVPNRTVFYRMWVTLSGRNIKEVLRLKWCNKFGLLSVSTTSHHHCGWPATPPRWVGGIRAKWQRDHSGWAQQTITNNSACFNYCSWWANWWLISNVFFVAPKLMHEPICQCRHSHGAAPPLLSLYYIVNRATYFTRIFFFQQNNQLHQL